MRVWLIALAVLAGAVVALSAWFLTKGENCDGPVTCVSDAQCGGEVTVKLFCLDGDVYAEGQRNKCINPSPCTSFCETSFEPWLVKKCSKGCEEGACRN